LENLKGRDHLEDLGIDGKTILEWILRKYGRRVINVMHITHGMLKQKGSDIINITCNENYLIKRDIRD
jgi:hypothetical protein